MLLIFLLYPLFTIETQVHVVADIHTSATTKGETHGTLLLYFLAHIPLSMLEVSRCMVHIPLMSPKATHVLIPLDTDSMPPAREDDHRIPIPRLFGEQHPW